MSKEREQFAVSLFSEILTIDQLARNRIARVLPRGMELSHFSVLNHLAHVGQEKTPAQLARNFHLTRGAMTNTLSKLEWAGWIHVRPDWEDARRKLVSISPAGLAARNAAISAISPVIVAALEDLDDERIRTSLKLLRDLRRKLISDV